MNTWAEREKAVKMFSRLAAQEAKRATTFDDAAGMARDGRIKWAGRPCRIYGRLNDFPTVVLWPEDDTETEVSWALLARYIKAGGGNIRA